MLVLVAVVCDGVMDLVDGVASTLGCGGFASWVSGCDLRWWRRVWRVRRPDISGHSLLCRRCLGPGHSNNSVGDVDRETIFTRNPTALSTSTIPSYDMWTLPCLKSLQRIVADVNDRWLSSCRRLEEQMVNVVTAEPASCTSEHSAGHFLLASVARHSDAPNAPGCAVFAHDRHLPRSPRDSERQGETVAGVFRSAPAEASSFLWPLTCSKFCL